MGEFAAASCGDVGGGRAVLDLMGKRGATDRDTVVRTIRQNLSPCSCFHPVRSASEVAERAL